MPPVTAPPPDADPRALAALVFAGRADGELAEAEPEVTFLGTGIDFGRARARPPWQNSNDPLMSRQHARIGRAGDGTYWVRDLGSTNGTYVDGVKVPADKQRPLRPGSVLMMGSHVFVFRQLGPDALEAIRADARAPFALVATRAAVLALVVRELRQRAAADGDLLLLGETGVGKEVHAEAVHRASGRRGPFVAIRCAALPQGRVDSELFGDRGAPSPIERAEGGTLFLDDIDELPATAQAVVLRFLQTREILPLGATEPRRLDVRVVAATSQPLGATGPPGERRLRHDLAAQLGPALKLPPLRDRIEDLGALVRALWPGRVPPFAPEAYLALHLHAWRGNVRELGKALEVARVLAHVDGPVEIEHLPEAVAAHAPESRPPARARRKQRPTREELVTLLAQHGGDVARVARAMGRQRTLVWRWLREDAVRVDDFKPPES